MGKCLYIDFWKAQIPFIKETILSGKGNQTELDIAELQACSQNGDRQTLRFRVSIQDGIASTRTNSAIARDLCSVLNNTLDLENISTGKTIILNLVDGNMLNVAID